MQNIIKKNQILIGVVSNLVPETINNRIQLTCPILSIRVKMNAGSFILGVFRGGKAKRRKLGANITITMMKPIRENSIAIHLLSAVYLMNTINIYKFI